MLRIIVRNLYDSNEEWEEVEAAAISSRPPPTQEPASRPTYNLRPKPADPALKNALPDYSRAVWSVIGCLVIAVIAMHWLRSQPMTVAAPTHQTATLIEKTDAAAATEDHLKAEHLHPHISEDNMQIAR
uniref:Uncharacterized protein n=1 Tax=Spongospora subterranea TaxID=70186 RepID=A0A0H5QS87_9EUKA|eukprot:CRZ04835.1 hypothetical protein [Spongospora subterranea]